MYMEKNFTTQNNNNRKNDLNCFCTIMKQRFIMYFDMIVAILN